MVKNPELLSKFEQNLASSRLPDYAYSLKIFEALHSEAVALGVLPLADPLEGVETTITLARSLNHVPRTSGQTSR